MATGEAMKLLILSDIHANWPALEAVLRAEPDFDSVAFCGDAVAYGPHPTECVRWLADHADHAVRGNHDNALAHGLDCRCLESSRECALATHAWHRDLLSDADHDFLRGRLTLDYFEWQGRHFQVAHATPYGDLYEYLPASRWGERVRGLGADFVLLGHTHVQGMRSFGRTTVVNPGSVGLARDRRGEACYATFEKGQIRLKRIPYETGRTLAALHAAPLPGPVIEGLTRMLVGPDAARLPRRVEA
jgi:putative phosphoesterase